MSKVDQSYVVLDWLIDSMRKVSDNPKLLGEFLFNYTQKAPEIVDAVMPLILEEHRGQFIELFKASTKMGIEVLKWTTKR